MKFVYPATVIRIHDGDSLRLNVELPKRARGKDTDFGFSIHLENGGLHIHEDFRLLGLNCAELATPSGKAAQCYLASLLSGKLTIQTVKEASHDKREKYGRFLVTIWVDGRALEWDTSINAEMIRSGHAAAWDGKGPAPVP